MHIAHGLGWYFPESTGGTENHVAGLATGLKNSGHQTWVLAPRSGDGPLEHVYRDVPVHRYESLGEPGKARATSFAGLLERFKPDIYHGHAWTARSGLKHLEIAKAMGFQTVLTILVPANICLKGTLIKGEQEVCSGAILESQCAACWSTSRGLPKAIAGLAPHVPEALSALIAGVPKLATALPLLAARARVAAKRAEFEHMVALSDRIIVVAQWLADTLRANGVPAEKIALCRMGLADSFAATLRNATSGGPTKICYFGRYDPVKGIDTLIEALKAQPDGGRRIELDIYGLANTKKDEACQRRLEALAGGDNRITFKPSIPPEAVVGVVGGYDAMAVPSKWLETGPLVVLEAIEAQVPVLGANLGGIAELVTPGETGTLLPAFDVDAWTRAFTSLANGTLKHTPSQARLSARKMSVVTAETVSIYDRLLSAGRAKVAAL